MFTRYFSNYVRSWGTNLALAMLFIAPVGTALALPEAKNVLNSLPRDERTALRNGQVMMSGRNGQFTGRVLINASLAETWQVLTDYDNFEQFLPNIENSRWLESSGDRNVFEQINVVQVLPFVTNRSRIVIESLESYPQQINFGLIEGDLQALQGVWYFDSVYHAGREQVLLTHEVYIDPGQSSTRGVFFNTYRNVLTNSLRATKVEAERRAGR